MLALGHLLKQRRHAMGLTLAQVAQRAEITKGYLSMIENGRADKPPSAAVLDRLEVALQLEPNQLTDVAQWQATPPAIRQTMQQLADDAQRARAFADWLRQATSRRAGGGKNLDKLYRSGQLAKKLNQTFASQTSEHRDDSTKDQTEGAMPMLPHPVKAPSIPLINHVAAGYPKGFTDLDYPARIADDYIAAPRNDDPDAFAATVVGESMTPEYREGDIVVFSPLADVVEGCDCFARIEPDHETTFKRVFFEDQGNRVRLQPLNPKFPPRILDREDIAGLYRAVWKISKL